MKPIQGMNENLLFTQCIEAAQGFYLNSSAKKTLYLE
jgi:hypothetical protein